MRLSLRKTDHIYGIDQTIRRFDINNNDNDKTMIEMIIQTIIKIKKTMIQMIIINK